MKPLCTGIALLLLLGAAAAELPDVVAKYGSRELKKELFKNFNLPPSPAERSKVLKKLVDTEVYLLIIRDLLERSGIAPDADTARRYLLMRKKALPAPRSGGNFFKELEKQTSRGDFQLKCALYFTFYAVEPGLVEPAEEEIMKHYARHKDSFRTPVESRLAIFKAGPSGSDGKKQADLILSRLRQGEEFSALARQFDPQGRENAPELQTYAQRYFKEIQALPAGGFTAVENENGIFIIKVVSRKESAFLSYTEASFYIRELLSSQKLKLTLEKYMGEMLKKNPVQYFFQLP